MSPSVNDNPLIIYFIDTIWPQLVPIFTVLNILAGILVCVLFWYYWYVRGKLNALRKEQSKKVESLFDWVKVAPIKNPRWQHIEQLAASTNSSDWRVAVIEADGILDEIIKKRGYPGETMGERMQAIGPNDFPFLTEAWRVHKLRNILAHETSYDLQKGEMEDAIDAYHLIFKEVGFLGK